MSELRILYPEHIDLIQNAIEVAHICGIQSIIINDDQIRGIDNGKSVCIIRATDIELPFKSLCTERVDALKRKFDMAADMDDLMVNVVVDENEETRIQRIAFTGYTLNGTVRTLFNHRCARPGLVKAPSAINDNCTTPIKLPNGIYKFLAQADKKSELEIASDQDGAELQLKDGTGDVLAFEIHKQPSPKFHKRYSLRIVKTLLKISLEETTWLIGKKGVIKTNLRGLDVYILPMV